MRQLRNMYSKTLIRNTRPDFIQQRDLGLLIPLRRDMRDNMQILDMLDLLVQSCEFVEVSRKETKGVDLRSDVL